MNERNLRRCLLSWGYLAGMLWLLLLIAWITLFRTRRWAEMSRTPAFLALLALLFSGVGNRGLIKNSIVAAHFVPPRTAPGYFLELDLNATVDSGTDLFWDTGHGFNSSERTVVFFSPGPIQIARFPLPLANKIVRLRWDPLSRPGAVDVRSIRLVDATGRTALRLPLDSLKPTQQIASVALHDQRLEIHTTPDATDPNLEFTPDTVAAIARVLSPGP